MKAYECSPMDVLEVVDNEHFLFHIKSETNPSIWYSVSSKTYYCNCSDRVSTCKHIFGVQCIVKEFFEKPKDDELMEEILHMESNIENIDVMNSFLVDEPMEEATSNDVMREKVLNSLSELNSLCRVSLYVDNEEEMKRKLQALQSCIAIFLEPLNFERPKTINLPLRCSISFIQENVKHTKMGHERIRVIF